MVQPEREVKDGRRRAVGLGDQSRPAGLPARIQSSTLEPGITTATLFRVLPARFKIISDIQQIETIAIGRGIHHLDHLRKRYGARHWRKRKGLARVELEDGTIGRAEIHWYEAHGVGKKELKLKWFRED